MVGLDRKAEISGIVGCFHYRVTRKPELVIIECESAIGK